MGYILSFVSVVKNLLMTPPTRLDHNVAYCDLRKRFQFLPPSPPPKPKLYRHESSAGSSLRKGRRAIAVRPSSTMSDGYKRPASVVYLGGGPALKSVDHSDAGNFCVDELSGDKPFPVVLAVVGNPLIVSDSLLSCPK